MLALNCWRWNVVLSIIEETIPDAIIVKWEGVVSEIVLLENYWTKVVLFKNGFSESYDVLIYNKIVRSREDIRLTDGELRDFYAKLGGFLGMEL